MEAEKMNNLITIQVRYCFDDENSHSMDAEVFNECEKQFIKAIKSVEKYLSTTLPIDIKPREEGSLFDIFTIDLTNILIGGVVNILISAVVNYFFTLKTSKDI